MSFEALKKNRKSLIDKLISEAEKSNGGGGNVSNDDHYWKPQVDKSGNGYAVIRFLPASAEDQTPWAQWWDHGFKGPTGRWYIEKSLTSIGQDDPVSTMNTQLWNTGRDEDKELARSRKRRLHYVSNILVISDPSNPENEGKVFLYKYGKKIFSKVMDAMQPEFEDETPINPFDFWEGANFKLKIRKVEGYWNYDKSEFDSPSELKDGDDEELAKIYDELHSFEEYTDPANYKSYADLEKKLMDVLGESTMSVREDVVAEDPADTLPSKEKQEKDADELFGSSDSDDSEDSEDMQSFFAQLAKDD